MMPPTQGMLDMVKMEKPAGYSLASGAKTITDTVNKKLRPEAFNAQASGQTADAEKKDSHDHVKTPVDPLSSGPDGQTDRLHPVPGRFFMGHRKPCPWGPPTFWWASCYTCLPSCPSMIYPKPT